MPICPARNATRGGAPITPLRTAADSKTSLESKQHAQDNDQPFRFLDLPPELRNQVYEYAFTTNDLDRSGVWAPGLGRLSVVTWARINADSAGLNFLSLLTTCCQIYEEARSIPFSCNIIFLRNVRDLARASGNMDLGQLAAVRSIEIVALFAANEAQYWGMLKFFPNLSHLRIVDRWDAAGRILEGRFSMAVLKIKNLKGLAKLEFVPDDDVIGDPSIYAQKISDASQVEAMLNG